MRAAVFRGLHRPLVVGTLADPVPTADEVIVKVGRCGVCGSDLHMTEDAAFGLAEGAVLGHEFAGEVVDAGSSVRGLRVGDRVSVAPLRSCGRCGECLAGRPAWCAQMSLQGGGYGDYASATGRQCRRINEGLSFEDGALVEPLAVTHHGVRLAEIEAGARVLVLGAGPIGLGAAYWARKAGAGRVVVRDIADDRRDLAHVMGADAFVGASEAVAADIEAALGGPADVVFECVGKPGLISESVRYLRPRGTVLVLGLCTAHDPWIPFEALSKEARIQTSAFFEIADFEAALADLEAGAAEPHAMITDTVSLGDLPTAFEALKRRTSQCKVMIDPGLE